MYKCRRRVEPGTTWIGTNPAAGARFSKVPWTFRAGEKPLVNLRPANSVKLVFSYVVKGIKIKITAKFRASRLLRFEHTKRIMSPEIRPKSFGTFEKRAPGQSGTWTWLLRSLNLHLESTSILYLNLLIFLARFLCTNLTLLWVF